VVIGAQYEIEVGNGVDRAARLVPVAGRDPADRRACRASPRARPTARSPTPAPALAAAAPFTREVEDLSASISYDLDSGLSFALWGRNLLDSRDVG
jgi:hypothetical protein